MTHLLPERLRPDSTERWEPLEELTQMSDWMGRLMDQGSGRLSVGWPSLLRDARGWAPFADIEEGDDSYVIEAELPGVKRDQIAIELVGNELAISGDLQETVHTGVIRRRTRRTGHFEYRVILPQQIDAEAIEATLVDGVLTVRAPKAHRAERHTVPITTPDAA